jgi:hypothetical protein
MLSILLLLVEAAEAPLVGVVVTQVVEEEVLVVLELMYRDILQ